MLNDIFNIHLCSIIQLNENRWFDKNYWKIMLHQDNTIEEKPLFS